MPGTQEKLELDIDLEDSRCIVSKILKVTSEKEEKHMENTIGCPCNHHLPCLNSTITMMGFNSLGTEFVGLHFFYDGFIHQFPN